MGISRLHIALLAIMSIFTGIIAPGTATDTSTLAYPMTDVRGFTYFLLLLLILGFYTASIHAWRYFRYVSILILGMIMLLFFLTLGGQVLETKTGLIAHGLSWGWIFLAIGTLLIMKAYRGEKGGETVSELRQTIDTLLGIVGSFTLACIAGVIIMISMTFTGKSYQESILGRYLGSGNTVTMSGGITLSRDYIEIPYISYDRKLGALVTSLRDASGWTIDMHSEQGISSISGSFRTPIIISERLYTYDANGRVFSGMTELGSATMTHDREGILFRSGSDYNIRTTKGSWTLDYSGSIQDPILSGDKQTMAWIEQSGSGYMVRKMGALVGTKYENVYALQLSQGGYDMMALVEMSGALTVVKNGTPIYQIGENYISRSYSSNGSHFISIQKSGGQKEVVYDGTPLPQKYDEIREVFLDKTAGTYAFFARPTGGTEYCLYTKYRGNLCGLDGYMNPRLSGDNSSILYAGNRDGKWGIYRNTELLVSNTNYTNTDISGDYVFFDVTNPRTYLFVKKEQKTGKYTLIKNGKILPGVWDDFGTDVSFGYDNHIILKLRDSSGWRIAEI